MQRFFFLSIFLQLVFVYPLFSQTDSLEFMYREAEQYLEKRDSIIDAKKSRLAILIDSLNKFSAENNFEEEYRLSDVLT